MVDLGGPGVDGRCRPAATSCTSIGSTGGLLGSVVVAKASGSSRKGSPSPGRHLRRWSGEVIRWAAEVGTRLGAADHSSRQAARFGSFGEGSIITFPQGAIYGESYIHIGEGSLIGPHVTLSVGIVPGQTMATDPVIAIGNGCLIGRGTAIVGHFEIEIGDDVFTGMNVYITDQNHTYERLDQPIGRQDPRDEPVRIGAGSWIGTGAVILPGSTIGEHVVVAANAVVRGDVPDRCVVAGVPARVVRRHAEPGGWQTGPAVDHA